MILKTKFVKKELNTLIGHRFKSYRDNNMVIYPSGLRGLSAKQIFIGSNPIMTSKKCLVNQEKNISLFQK